MKRLMIFLLVALLAFSVIGCAKKDTNPNEDTNIVNEEENKGNDEALEDEIEDEIVDPSPNTEEVEVVLYFANKKYVETGDESYEKLVAEKRRIEYGNIPLEEAIVKELIKGPESDELSSSIPETVKLLGVETADGTCYVNFAQEGLYGGSLQEDFTIAQVVNSLLELEHVDRVQFLIDGEKAESLMGHFSIIEPFDEPMYIE
ncbi:MAG: GerMN domain-containing protein [Tissierellia bacterium]|nr:GerMN domain-containing protein [Tissierellia bacterium]